MTRLRACWMRSNPPLIWISAAAFRRMLEICEREDPAYNILHRTVNLTAKRRDVQWRTGQSFAMDFSPRNWGGVRG
jgi:peptide/nickel transport system substrate-binding protein